ncbi:MAG: LysR family transcriptional regulator [Dehalococcoidia bacterium]|nr:LysR family transcriptional regulator [Dehalococcoidia bacterium]
MKIEAIRSFLQLVESGSYAAAAEELYTSPTTLHSHVKAIQSELNAALVRFDGRRLDLTAAGHQFLVFAERTVREYDAIREGFGRSSRPKQRLRIASMIAPSIHILPGLLDTFHRARPETVVVVETGSLGDSIAALTSREADVAVMYSGIAARHTDTFAMTPILESHLAAIIRADLVDRSPLDLLARYPIAAPVGTASTRQYFERWARQHEVEVSIPFEYSSSDAILTHVRAGGCIGLMGSYVASDAVRNGDAHELELPDFEQDHTVVALHARDSNLVVREFIDLCERFYAAGGHLEPISALA